VLPVYRPSIKTCVPKICIRVSEIFLQFLVCFQSCSEKNCLHLVCCAAVSLLLISSHGYYSVCQFAFCELCNITWRHEIKKFFRPPVYFFASCNRKHRNFLGLGVTAWFYRTCPTVCLSAFTCCSDRSFGRGSFVCAAACVRCVLVCVSRGQ